MPLLTLSKSNVVCEYLFHLVQSQNKEVSNTEPLNICCNVWFVGLYKRWTIQAVSKFTWCRGSSHTFVSIVQTLLQFNGFSIAKKIQTEKKTTLFWNWYFYFQYNQSPKPVKRQVFAKKGPRLVGIFIILKLFLSILWSILYDVIFICQFHWSKKFKTIIQ